MNPKVSVQKWTTRPTLTLNIPVVVTYFIRKISSEMMLRFCSSPIKFPVSRKNDLAISACLTPWRYVMPLWPIWCLPLAQSLFNLFGPFLGAWQLPKVCISMHRYDQVTMQGLLDFVKTWGGKRANKKAKSGFSCGFPPKYLLQSQHSLFDYEIFT